MRLEIYRPCFHEVTVVSKIVTQSECNFFSLPSLRENSDDIFFAYFGRHKILRQVTEQVESVEYKTSVCVAL